MLGGRARRVAWENVVAADLPEPGTTDHTNLRALTEKAALAVEEQVTGSGPAAVAWNAGVLARYGQMAVVDRLRSQAGRVDSPLRTLWLVVFGSTADTLPVLHGQRPPSSGHRSGPTCPSAGDRDYKLMALDGLPVLSNRVARLGRAPHRRLDRLGVNLLRSDSSTT